MEAPTDIEQQVVCEFPGDGIHPHDEAYECESCGRGVCGYCAEPIIAVIRGCTVEIWSCPECAVVP